MTITTSYKTNSAGRSQIIAKSGGKQKTTNYNQAKSNDWNHGNAAGEFLVSKDSDDRLLLAGERWEHDSNDSGTIHTFRIVNGR